MRFEYKYAVSVDQLDALRDDITQFTTLDAFAARHATHHYTVRSIYMDTPRLAAYYEKLDGAKVRRKLRIRSYDDCRPDSIAFLEIKAKDNQRGTKYRAPVHVRDIDALIAGGEAAGLVQPGSDPTRTLENANRFLFHYIRSSMRPVILIEYEREAFLGLYDHSLRITFDKCLRFAPYPSIESLYEESALRHVAPQYFVLEVKFDHSFAPWLSNIIRKFNLTRTSVSKYCACLEASGIVSSRGRRRVVAERQYTTYGQESEVPV